MNYGFWLKHPMQDKEWLKKVAIGGVITIVPILNFALFGYWAEIIRGVLEGRSEELPAWDNIGGKIIEGLKLFVVGLIYSIVPFIVMMSGQSQMLSTGTIPASYGLGMLLGLVIGIFVPMAYLLVIKEGSLGAAFRVGEVIKRTLRVIGKLIVVWLIYFGLSLVIGIVFLVPVLGWIAGLLGLVYLTMASGGIFADLYRLSEKSEPVQG